MNQLINIERAITKRDQQDAAQTIINAVADGITDPIDVAITLKSVAEIIKMVTDDKQFSSCLIDEAEKYGKTFTKNGVELSLMTRATKDLSGLDPVLDSLYAEAESIKAQIKAREATVETGSDPATGEVFGPVKKSVITYLKYKF